MNFIKRSKTLIIKTKIGKSFGGCVRYNLGRDQAEVLQAEGVRADCAQHMVDDFNHVRKQNPELSKSVWHTSISFAPEDKVSEQLMKDIAKDYVDKFKLEQYAIIRHVDQGQTHFHIVGNRVKYDGQTVSDQFCASRGVELAQRLEKKYELTQARTVGKRLNLTHEDKLQGADKTKYEIYRAVQKELPQSKSLEDLQTKLKSHGITADIKTQSTGKVYGITFAKDGNVFKGSAIDKNLAVQQLSKTLETVLKNLVPGLSQATKVLKIAKGLSHGMEM
jgi:hypothetical protein